MLAALHPPHPRPGMPRSQAHTFSACSHQLGTFHERLMLSPGRAWSLGGCKGGLWSRGLHPGSHWKGSKLGPE